MKTVTTMKTAVIALNVILIIGLIPSAWGALFSPMLFDSGATKRTWIIFGAIVALPILIVITQIISWIAYSKGNYGLALKVSLIPVTDILILVALFMYSDKLT